MAHSKAASDNVVIIGCGNIGTRLLQSILKVSAPSWNAPLAVYCIDANPDAAALVATRHSELGEIAANVPVHFLQDITDLPKDVRLAIIATTSGPRFSILQDLLAHCSPELLLLEKFLFTRWDDYDTATALIAKAGSKTFVHAPRSVWEGYQAIINGEVARQPIQMTVTASDWAMASNAIHFVAPFMAITGEAIADIDASGLDAKVIPNKRAGYKEVTGYMDVMGDKGSRLRLWNTGEGAAPLSIDVAGRSGRYFIREGLGQMDYATQSTDWKWETAPIGALYASTMDHIFEEILTTNACALPSYAEMVDPHRRLIEVFNTHFFGPGNTHEPCPIT